MSTLPCRVCHKVGLFALGWLVFATTTYRLAAAELADLIEQVELSVVHIDV